MTCRTRHTARRGWVSTSGHDDPRSVGLVAGQVYPHGEVIIRLSAGGVFHVHQIVVEARRRHAAPTAGLHGSLSDREVRRALTLTLTRRIGCLLQQPVTTARSPAYDGDRVHT